MLPSKLHVYVTSFAPLSVFFLFFLEMNTSWAPPSLFPQYKKLINVILTTCLVSLFHYMVYTAQEGGEFSIGRHFHWGKQAPADAQFLKEKFTLGK